MLIHFVSAAGTESRTRCVHHSAALTADAGHLSGNSVLRRRLTVVRRLSHRLTVGLTLHWLTVRLHWLTIWVCVGIAVWAAVRIAVLEGLISEVGTGDSDHKTDDPQEKSADKPSAKVGIAFVFHYVAHNKAPDRTADKTADQNTYPEGSVIVIINRSQTHKKSLPLINFNIIIQFSKQKVKPPRGGLGGIITDLFLPSSI